MAFPGCWLCVHRRLLIVFALDMDWIVEAKMKVRVFVFCSVLVLALVGLYFAISRDQPSNPPMANANEPADAANEMRLERLTKLGSTYSDRAPVTADQSQNTDENQIDEDCLATGKPFSGGNIKVVSVTRGDCLAYPQISTPLTPQERGFNRYVLKLIGSQLKLQPKGTRKKECEDGDEFDFAVSYATPEFVSLNLITSFCGASCHAFGTPLNYDLKAGRPIKSLAELFKPRSNYLKTIASYCVSELKRCEGFRDGDEWFEKGTKLTASNYDNWSLGRNGVSITFDEYQIAPGVYPGASVVIPYDHLKSIWRKDVE